MSYLSHTVRLDVPLPATLQISSTAFMGCYLDIFVLFNLGL